MHPYVFSGYTNTACTSTIYRAVPTAMLSSVFFSHRCSPTHGLPELLAGAAVVGLHLWEKNTLLSIAVGTALYMVLVQAVFV